MKDLFLKITEEFDRQRDLFTNAGLLPIATIGLYNGQAEQAEVGGEMCPALFVEYATEWESGNQQLKKGVLSLSVHVIVPTASGQTKQTGNKWEKLEYYCLVGEIMEGVETEGVSRLSLIGEAAAHTAYFHYQILRFSALIYKSKPKNRALKDIPAEISLTKG